ncbi:ergothioneine biosynthesis protein EgtB [Sphingomonas sp. AP4-R1]|uniref:ergothioneine biosynthesis protein EgtB n=1 Tax=Sphingomonas sp. AP4-R1 TaxID=2735134 RepID=UPI001493704E|nr:ergothioneine biosynthesis protein EgtB [Sphingomonas sp. AP4-R1]QJU56889.1 ergothioneine biosynthesis protein EgtB [Sphingomonas sp. AP4-R1]
MAACAERLIGGTDLAARFAATRALSVDLVAPLSDADATIQPHPDASPAKWHLAHTTWFFETFVLRDHVAGHRPFDPRFAFLFNSYYEAEGERHPRAHRGMLSRPSLAEILAWRAAVDEQMAAVIDDLPCAVRDLIELGVNHEQQHQELLLTDLLATFAENPIAPAIWEHPRPTPAPVPGAMGWIEGRDGPVMIGHDASGEEGAFAFDCEGPRHAAMLHPHAIADRLVTNAEWQAFMADGGYQRPDHWLSDGWAWVRRERIEAPLYWRRAGGGWVQFGLDGLHPLHPAAAVTHVSHYEADAYARWAGVRLPTEAEWESAAQGLDPTAGNQLDAAGPVRPRAASRSGSPAQMFGDCWQWTGSAYLPYPGFKTAEGAVGEYNGKFMSGQAVLKGASCATPRGHSRASYRNFFYPHQRWQFTGVRLAKDL